MTSSCSPIGERAVGSRRTCGPLVLAANDSSTAFFRTSADLEQDIRRVREHRLKRRDRVAGAESI